MEDTSLLRRHYKMYSLILDSATKILYVALINDGNVLYEKYIEGSNDHAKNIVFRVDEALNTAGIKAKDLDEIICGVGPGSYTGVRMAVTVCKMLSIFMKKSLYTISTLQLISSSNKGVCLSMIDARRGNAFGCIIDNDKNEYIIDEALYSKEYLEAEAAKYTNVSVSTEARYKVDPLYVLRNKVLVKEPHLLVPNYLRETEAERNLHDKKN